MNSMQPNHPWAAGSFLTQCRILHWLASYPYASQSALRQCCWSAPRPVSKVDCASVAEIVFGDLENGGTADGFPVVFAFHLDLVSSPFHVDVPLDAQGGNLMEEDSLKEFP